MTTDVQVAEMRDFAEYIQSNSYIKEAIVDDWGLYGNFSIIITPHTHEKTSTNKIKGIINKELKNKKYKMRQIISPSGKYDQNNKRVYDINYWKVDIDYQTYISETNSFV